MVAIVFHARSGTYRLFKRGNHSGMLRPYLHQVPTNEFKIVLIYDHMAKRTLYKDTSYHEHYRRLRKRYSARAGADQATEICMPWPVSTKILDLPAEQNKKALPEIERA